MLDLLAADRIDSFVIDAEVVALDKETAAFRTFQDLSNRAKKDVKVEDIKVIVGVFSFDLMLLNDQVRTVHFTHEQALMTFAAAFESTLLDTASSSKNYFQTAIRKQRYHDSSLQPR